MRRHMRRTVSASAFMACAALTAQIGTGSARAAGQRPVVYTGGTSALTASSVVLAAGINPSGQETSYVFQYGQTPGYGTQTSSVSVGNATQVQNVTASVGGLAADTAYHFRVVAVNGAGTSFGADHSFTTKKIPLTFDVSALPARDVFGWPVSVSGTLSGTGAANHELVLQANRFPFLAGFTPYGAPVLSDANGYFSFPAVALTQNTQLRVATRETPPSVSRVMVERVGVHVTLHARTTARHGFVRLYGAIAPGQTVAVVFFQFLRPGHKPQGVGRVVVTGARHGVSHFDHVVPVRHAGLYRAFVSVLSGAQVSNHSRTVLIR
jgi:hypothetical protein